MSRDASHDGVHNTVSGGLHHNVVQGRDFTGPITINCAPIGPPAARSAYPGQVRRLAPDSLVGRAGELAELAAFCRGEGDHPYAWWRAGPWAGKTALMAWFSTHPPQGVRIVPFFVTARLGPQNDRTAFVDVVLEQLAELADEPIPARGTAATREAHLFELLQRASQICAQRGERLVLLVDGLDEDRGVTAGPDAHSIAGALPYVTDDSLRVIVTGRPSPPLPPDVPEEHPLRVACDVRDLAPSPEAQVIRGSAEKELSRLFAEGGRHLSVLGLLTAAGDGLTATDLAQLTESAPYQLNGVLRTVAARTFERRETPYDVGGDRHVYLLAHEELQVRARDLLGPAQLDHYREQLHAWAARYQERGWPDDTPGYVLGGYFSLLGAERDLPRMLVLATDARRQERLYRATHGDAAALGAIRATEQLILEDGRDRLPDMLRLALHRAALAGRNYRVPKELPHAWATLGRFDRAKALALSLPTGYEQLTALLLVAEELRAQGRDLQAHDVVTDAEATVRRLANKWYGDHLLCSVVTTWLAWGELEQAERVAATIASDSAQEEALPAIVSALLDRDLLDRAASVARAAPTEPARTLTLIQTATAAGQAGDGPRAKALFAEASRCLRRLGDGISDLSDDAVGAIARGFAAAGEHVRARAFIRALEQRSHKKDGAYPAKAELALARLAAGDTVGALALVRDPEPNNERHLIAAARVLTALGAYDRVEALVRSAGEWDRVSGICLMLAEAGQPDRALALAKELRRPEFRLHEDLSWIFVRQGHFEHAERAVHEGPDEYQDLGDLILTLMEAGQPDRARALLDRAEPFTSRSVHLAMRARVQLTEGRTEQARDTALAIPQMSERAWALAPVARALAADGRSAEAEALLIEAEVGYRDPPSLLNKAGHRAEVATELARAGRHEHARALLEDIELRLHPDGSRSELKDEEGWEFDAVSTALVETRQLRRALRLMDLVPDGQDKDGVTAGLARALARPEHRHLAATLAQGIERDYIRLSALSDICRALVEQGDCDGALALAMHVLDSTMHRTEILARVVERLVKDGQSERAAALYRRLRAEPFLQSHSLCAVRALAAYAIGDLKTMAAHLDRAEDDSFMRNLMSGDREMARALVIIGYIPRAEAYVRRQPGLWEQLQARFGLIEGLAEVGEFDRAEQHVRDWSEYRDAAYGVLALATDPTHASKAAALAVHFDDWYKALPALRHADPRTLDVLTAPGVWPWLIAD
ncbi:hypothetical protein AB0H82_36245 [Streptomyces sp. NPDC050732]|uniref:hypothetical protein n=1 Tax=Streptomyces sp. NPDC050732 TaxID=3154632 RepID=UPI00342C4746